MTLYLYDGCSTCKSALKWLHAHGIVFQTKAIRETPPTLEELRAMWKALGCDDRLLFNTSGQEYRLLDLKTKLPHMSLDQKLELLASNGHLVKRPFLIDAEREVHLVGFKESKWLELLDRMK